MVVVGFWMIGIFYTVFGCCFYSMTGFSGLVGTDWLVGISACRGIALICAW